ncbi:hypothetical protein ACFL6G_01340 [candidate division KSB1 bacterium]
MEKTRLFLILITITLFSCSEDYQIADKDYNYRIDDPAFEKNTGPVVLVDEAHNNFHTIDGRYSPFAKLLENDGYIVRKGNREITPELLNSCSVFVVSVAIPDGNNSAFSDAEIVILKEWVNSGGSFLLITDHHPDVPGVEKLAAAFGVTLNNGYALEGPPNDPKPVFFKKENNSLAAHPLTDGRNEKEKVNSVATFTGCAFQAGPDFIPVLIFGPDAVSWMPEEPWTFLPETKRISVEGWYQGAVSEPGKGRIAVFGEAAMFTAQLFGKDRVPSGFNMPEAEENARFLLNIFHWLSRLI